MKLLFLINFCWLFFLNQVPSYQSNRKPTETLSFTQGCPQEYKFFFKNKHDDTFWIGENLYGECEKSSLIQLFIDSRTNTCTERISEFKSFDRWESIVDMQKHMATDHVIILNGQQGQINYSAMQMQLISPPTNIKLQTLKQNEYHDDCAKVWNSQMGSKGIDMPQIKGAKISLVHAYSGGLYFNYSIDKAYIFPDSRYIVLFTQNKAICESTSTMHGFMVFKFSM
jgi:hypothetical protein